MCIAIYKAPHKVISKDVLEECFKSNKDGCGFAYINTDHLLVRKIKMYKSMDFDSFYHKYERATRFNPESPFIIHFRIATHGTVNKFNCHPFWIDSKTVFVHNGIISGVSKDEKKSDTQMFNEEFLQHIDSSILLKDGPVKKLIEKFVVGSKLVIMNVEGDIQIYNESAGNWQDGCWYSNFSWRKTASYSYNYGTGSSFRRHLSDLSYAKCEGCGKWFQINTMRAFRDSVDVDVFCKGCSDKVPEKYNMNELTIGQYIEYNNEIALYEM